MGEQTIQSHDITVAETLQAFYAVPDYQWGLPRVYIGEGDPIRPRLEQHAAKKDFWTSCIAFSSKDENLNKAHVQYLEARLVALASAAKRCILDNGNAPALPSLSEADAADAEGFLAEVLLCFPVLGLNVFTGTATAAPGRTLHLSAKGVAAQGAETAEGFVVRAKSGAVTSEAPSCPAWVKQLRGALVQNGVLATSGDAYVFTQDYVFASPSAAACAVLGRSANGRTEWTTKDGKTLKALQGAEAAE